MGDKKINIDFLVKLKERSDQGVHSASVEDLHLLREYGAKDYDVVLNRRAKYADIVHACDVHPQFYFKLKKAKLSLALVHFLSSTLQGSISLPKGIMNLYAKYVLNFYARADHLVTVNPQYVQRLVDLGFSSARVHYIPNCISPALFHPLSAKERVAARSQFNIGSEDKVVLSVGQTQPRKGIFDFIELAEDNPDVRFIWAGDFTFGRITADYRRVKKAIENCPPNLRFIGSIARERMNLLYGAADLYISTSEDELFPMTILEACSCGLPIAVRYLPLYEPILGDYVVKCSNVAEYSHLIKSFFADGSQLPQAGHENSLKLAQMYLPEKVYAQWDQLYRTILADPLPFRGSRDPQTRGDKR